MRTIRSCHDHPTEIFSAVILAGSHCHWQGYSFGETGKIEEIVKSTAGIRQSQTLLDKGASVSDRWDKGISFKPSSSDIAGNESDTKTRDTHHGPPFSHSQETRMVSTASAPLYNCKEYIIAQDRTGHGDPAGLVVRTKHQ